MLGRATREHPGTTPQRAHGEQKLGAFRRAFNESENALCEVYGRPLQELVAGWLANIR